MQDISPIRGVMIPGTTRGPLPSYIPPSRVLDCFGDGTVNHSYVIEVIVRLALLEHFEYFTIRAFSRKADIFPATFCIHSLHTINRKF
ncbi:hypothetical protein CEXT_552561 [Caerostris extrusa]|uniref:Uncharacterized protein n=1 Tax=Caerostris extrusa TaxID=172846 RepID=A0AAV4YA44_CAEEX|nr:hypothetical protein CEXT_552561 [Caerostris extrusa]